MEKLNLKEIKKIQLSILNYIDQICVENDIEYYLIWGTLLGAVRHGGYIPWDDDIDIAMTRSNYIKLISVFNDNASKYCLHSYENDEEINEVLSKVVDTSTYAVPFGNAKQYNDSNKLGVYVDVFIIENLPNNKDEIEKYIKLIKNLQFKILLSIRKFKIEKAHFIKDLIKCIVSIPFKMIGVEKYKHELKNQLNERTYKKSKNVSIMIKGDIYMKYKYYPFSLFGKPVYLEFEGRKYPVPCQYEQLLSMWYGDYMTLPNEEERKSAHDFDYYMIR